MPFPPRLAAVRVRVTALTVAATLAATGLAAGAPAWTPATSLGPASDLSLAVDHDGKVVALATRRDDTQYGIDAWVHPVSPAGWQDEMIDRHICPGYCGSFVSPDVQLDARGVATATWGVGYSNPFNTDTTVAVRPAGGGWQPLPVAGDRISAGISFTVGVGPSGAGVLVATCFYCDDEGNHHVAAWSVDPDGVGTRQLLSAAGDEGTPDVAVDGAGRVTVVWPGVRVATRDLAGVWSAPATIAAGASPVVAVSPSGVAEAAWIGSDGVVRSSRRPGPGAAWSAPVAISPGAGSLSAYGELDIAIDSGDKAVVTWAGADGRVRAAVRPAGAAWTAQAVSAGTQPRIALNPAGTAFITFLGPTGAPLAVTRPAGGVWSAPAPLGAAGASGLGVAADAGGNAVAAWISASGILQSSTFDATGPVLSAPSVPGTAVAGRDVTVSASAWDLWASVGPTTWDFGDGAISTGSAATHAYAAPGAYTVTARATDGLGNETAREAQITVSAPPVPAPPVVRPPPSAPAAVGSIGGVSVGVVGGSPATTPRPLSPAAATAARRKPALKATLIVPPNLRPATRAILTVRLNRRVGGALLRVQLRQGVAYRTIAQGRVSGMRIPVSLSFAKAGRYLLRVQITEPGRAAVHRVVPVMVRR